MDAYNHTAQHDHNKDYTSGIVWAFLLVFFGVVLLLNTLGVLSWGVWGVLWRFWPVVIILGGFQILVGKSKVGGIVTAGVALVVFFALFSLIMVREQVWSRDMIPGMTPLFHRIERGFGSPKATQLTLSEEKYRDLDEVVYDVNIDDGQLDIQSGDDVLPFKVDAKHFAKHGEPDVQTKVSDRKLTIQLQQKSPEQFFFLGYHAPEYQVILGRSDILTRFFVELGAGQGNIHLPDVNIAELKAKVGAGQLNVVLNNSLRDGASLNLEVGAGELVLELPKSIGYKVSYEVGVGSLKLSGDERSGLGRHETDKESANYQSAEKKITIQAKVGAGSLNIKSVEEL